MKILIMVYNLSDTLILSFTPERENIRYFIQNINIYLNVYYEPTKAEYFKLASSLKLYFKHGLEIYMKKNRMSIENSGQISIDF